MTDLVEWLRARLDEDEADAEILDSDSYWSESADSDSFWLDADSFWSDYAPEGFLDALDRQRAKLGAECAAKRRRIEALAAVIDGVQDGALVLAYELLQIEAIPYADRPGFDPAWRAG